MVDREPLKDLQVNILPEPRAVVHIGESPMPLYSPREGETNGIDDEQLKEFLNWLVSDKPALFWRRTSGNPDLPVTYEVIQPPANIRP